MSSPRAVEATGLDKTFGTTHAVRGIDLAVGYGERVGVIGPNGAGKTTTLLMLMGAIDPDHGTVDLLGHSLPSERSEAMCSLGFAAGYLPLPDRLTVTETLHFFAGLHGVADPRTATDEILDELSIPHLAGEQTNSLSSGQATLVGMAKALVHHPRLVILDEPTASLDPDVAFRVRDRLAALNREHDTTLLLTSHDMREVDELCDRVVFLRDGRVLADGPAETIVTDAGHTSLEAMFLAEAERHRRERIS